MDKLAWHNRQKKLGTVMGGSRCCTGCTEREKERVVVQRPKYRSKGLIVLPVSKAQLAREKRDSACTL